MRVWCRSNRQSDLSAPWRVGFCGDGTTDLMVGKEYVVYVIEPSAQGVPGYVLCGENYSYYPLHYPAELFEVADSHPSQYWEVGYWPARPSALPAVVVGFPEWVADWGFHYWVTEGREPETSVWQRYKRLIEEESHHPEAV